MISERKKKMKINIVKQDEEVLAYLRTIPIESINKIKRSCTLRFCYCWNYCGGIIVIIFFPWIESLLSEKDKHHVNFTHTEFHHILMEGIREGYDASTMMKLKPRAKHILDAIRNLLRLIDSTAIINVSDFYNFYDDDFTKAYDRMKTDKLLACISQEKHWEEMVNKFLDQPLDKVNTGYARRKLYLCKMLALHVIQYDRLTDTAHVDIANFVEIGTMWLLLNQKLGEKILTSTSKLQIAYIKHIHGSSIAVNDFQQRGQSVQFGVPVEDFLQRFEDILCTNRNYQTVQLPKLLTCTAQKSDQKFYVVILCREPGVGEIYKAIEGAVTINDLVEHVHPLLIQNLQQSAMERRQQPYQERTLLRHFSKNLLQSEIEKLVLTTTEVGDLFLLDESYILNGDFLIDKSLNANQEFNRRLESFFLQIYINGRRNGNGWEEDVERRSKLSTNESYPCITCPIVISGADQVSRNIMLYNKEVGKCCAACTAWMHRILNKINSGYSDLKSYGDDDLWKRVLRDNGRSIDSDIDIQRNRSSARDNMQGKSDRVDGFQYKDELVRYIKENFNGDRELSDVLQDFINTEKALVGETLDH